MPPTRREESDLEFGVHQGRPQNTSSTAFVHAAEPLTQIHSILSHVEKFQSMTSTTFQDCFHQVVGRHLWHYRTTFYKPPTRLKTSSRANWRSRARPWELESSSPRQTPESGACDFEREFRSPSKPCVWSETFSILGSSKKLHEMALRGFELCRAISASRFVK